MSNDDTRVAYLPNPFESTVLSMHSSFAGPRFPNFHVSTCPSTKLGSTKPQDRIYKAFSEIPQAPWSPGGERRELRLPRWVYGLLRSRYAHSRGDDGSAGFHCMLATRLGLSLVQHQLISPAGAGLGLRHLQAEQVPEAPRARCSSDRIASVIITCMGILIII